MRIVFVRRARTETHMLVRVQTDGTDSGTLALTHEQWESLRRGEIELYCGMKLEELPEKVEVKL